MDLRDQKLYKVKVIPEELNVRPFPNDSYSLSETSSGNRFIGIVHSFNDLAVKIMCDYFDGYDELYPNKNENVICRELEEYFCGEAFRRKLRLHNYKICGLRIRELIDFIERNV